VAREKVIAVDHFRGSPEHQTGKSHQSDVIAREGTTFNRFVENMRDVALLDYIEPIVAATDEAARGWSRPVRLLFIDGDHSYIQSKHDFETWSPFVVSQGIVCFHDINVWPGVTQFYNELRNSSRDFDEVAAIEHLRIMQRR
jgi:hypothetical protein